VANALLEHLSQRPVDLTVISGDLTQRARQGQYRQAAAFRSKLPGPQLVVPGNHDVPLWNVFARVFKPLSAYRRFITDDLEPVFEDEQLCVVGLNSARRCSARPDGFWKDGVIPLRALTRAVTRMSTSKSNIKLATFHHPILVESSKHAGDRLANADQVMSALASAGVDAVLYGHIHIPHVKLMDAMTLQMPRSVICSMAGTATSSRLRDGHANSYTRLWFDGDRGTAEQFDFVNRRFEMTRTHTFRRDIGGWVNG
jgi:3',5'-cyclic AMP phosphodiesterase CpdA